MKEWPSTAAQQRIIDFLDALEVDAKLDDHNIDLIERRLLPPWRRRERRCKVRDANVRQLGRLSVETNTTPVTSGRKLAKDIVAVCQTKPPRSDPRRLLVDAILKYSWRNQPPGFTTVRNALAGLPYRPKPKPPFVREVVRSPRLARR